MGSGWLMRLLVSGAGGFVGSALLEKLARRAGDEVIGIYRRGSAVAGSLSTRPAGQAALFGNLDSDQDWTAIPRLSHALIHTAARVHMLRDDARDPLAEYRKVNVEGTLNLARQAAAAGLRRFIFLSTIKVNGECTAPGSAFSAVDPAEPQDPYGVSKWEAECGLKEIATRTGMEVVIIRPPLVYGPGVKGNFRSMLRWLQRGVPLPLGAIRNRRSLVYLDNLIDLITLAIDHPRAANETFLVSDAEELSTPDLLRRAAAALGRPARLIPVPVSWLKAGAALAGKTAAITRLCDSLRVDAAKTRRLLDWNPAASVDLGLKRTAESFLREARH
jgi:UDP-glucose 4-epimerase